ncbi:serine/threonine-protein kinase [Nonomuraea typhae]|uniref:serine/threonine-protein kinase n=1 Tax=Nonomuraea typhae TaxID=2603600 RepID=UPI0012F843A8|nr:serine/threonine-protein kinase [Nonomuraea typhae]
MPGASDMPGASGTPQGVGPLTVGDPVIIGRYLLLGRLGAGGMGVVYLAEHPRGGVVALKTPHPAHLGDPTLRARFAEEVSFSRRVVPFCTAAVIEDGTDRDRPYLVTDYIPGPALSHVVAAGGPLTPDLAYGVALGAAAALAAVHDAGLVHRDLKPANVLLSPRGPRVIDFGIAREVDTLAAHTQAGQVMGSPGWVAPERLTGGPAVPASDVFAWGCLVAFAASGHHPFGRGEQDVLSRRILLEAQRLDAVPAMLRPAVEAALAKEPGARPRAADLLRALLAAGGVGDPWDLRAAVDGVLEELWTPVPHPQGEGRVRPAAPPRRRRARTGSPASHAGFAALATVSIAALTVIAAGNPSSPGSSGGSVIPEAPVVMPHGSAGSTVRPPGGGAVPVSVAPVVSASASGPAVTLTRTLTPSAVATPPPPSVPHATGSPPPGTFRPEPSREDDCANPAARDCPVPSGGITTIPQEGPGESPEPSLTPTDVPTTPATPAVTG